MDKKYINSMPSFSFNQSISDLLHHLLQEDISAPITIVHDQNKKPYGIIRMTEFYKRVAFGLQFNYTLKDICDRDYIQLKHTCTYINPELLITKVIIVTDENNFALGILDNNSVLTDYIRSDNLPSASKQKSLFSAVNFGFILADIHGYIESMNPAAKKMLLNSKIQSIERIDDLISKYNYSHLRQKYSLKYNQLKIEIDSYPVFDEKKQVKIALFLFDVSKYNANLTELSKLKSDHRELVDIIDNSYDEIYVTDKNGVCIFVNKACERIYGLKQEDMLGKTSAQMKSDGFISSDLSMEVIQTKHRLWDTQTTKIGQKILVIASPIFNKKGEVSKVVINSREISDMVDVRISVDNLNQYPYTNITDKIMELTLQSNRIIAESAIMKKVINKVTQVSQNNIPVLLFGENGTGKHVIATLIHEISKRRNNNLVRFNCSAYSNSQTGVKLFGYTDLSDKKKSTRGLLDIANGSTIYLDNIDEFPFDLQGKLLQALEDNTFTPINSNLSINSNFRVIASTKKDLKVLVRNGFFREDLYYRLNAMPITVPPLRERQDDIPFLIQCFMSNINQSRSMQKSISSDAINILTNYSWPGNIKELKNIIERLCTFSQNNQIDTNELFLMPEFSKKSSSPSNIYTNFIGEKDLPSILDILEKELLQKAMSSCKSTYKLAEILGISQATTVRKLQKHNLKF